MRKMFALVLSLALVFSTVSFAVAAPKDVADDAACKAAVERLISLGIVKGYEDDTYRPEIVVTRAEFATLVVKALGLDSAAAFSIGLTLFSDVPSDAWYAGYVNVAASQGLLKGYQDGTFRPMNVVTYPEALTILVRTLGYTEDDVIGSWPLNFIVKAADLGISDDVTITSGGTNRGDVALLLDNTLLTNVKRTDNDDESKTLLESKLGAVQKTMVVWGIPNADPTNADLEDNEVVLAEDEDDDDKYEASERDIYETTFDMYPLLGMEIKALVKDDVLISAIPTKNNRVITVDKDDYVDVDVDDDVVTLTYEIDDDEKDIDLIQDKTVVVYNNRLDKDYDIADDLEDAEFFTMIDFNKDDVVDFIKVTEYQIGPLFVDEVNEHDEIIATKNGGNIELEDVDEYVLIYNGKEIELDDLEEDDVIYIASSVDEDYKEIIVFRKVVEGKVTEEDGNTVTIKGREYEDPRDLVDVGFEGKFYIGMDDEIVKFDGVDTDGNMYGYVIAYKEVYDDFDDSELEGIKVKIGTAGGKKIIFELAGEVIINGDEYDIDDQGTEALDAVDDLLGTVVRYRVDSDNNIDVIKTVDYEDAVINKQDSEPDFDYDKLGDYYVTDETVILHVYNLYDVYNLGMDANYEGAIDYEDLDEDMDYDYFVYEVNDLNEVELVVIVDEEVETASKDFVALVDKVTETLNDDGDTVDKLYAWVDGVKRTYIGENDTVVSDFVKGTLVLLEFNTDEEIEEASLAVDVDGVVYAKDSRRIKIKNAVFDLADGYDVYVYDMDPDVDKITVGSLIDVKVKSSSVEGSYVEVYLNSYDEVEIILVYKNRTLE